jgi:hypothetical protein
LREKAAPSATRRFIFNLLSARAEDKYPPPVRTILDQFSKKHGANGLRFWSNELLLDSRVEKLLRIMLNGDDSLVDVLKTSERRSVFRIRDFSPEIPSVIIKGFPLRKIESKWKYKKYGLTEFKNYQMADLHKIPAPKCYGYFESRGFGFVHSNGVVIEDLQNYQSLWQLAEMEPGNRLQIFLRAIPIFKMLFEKGVNHIDVTPQNLMQSQDGSELRVIDWQYCSFVAPRQPVQLILQAGHFLKYANLSADSVDGQCWLEQLFVETNCPMDKSHFFANVASLQNRPKIGATSRLNLQLQIIDA